LRERERERDGAGTSQMSVKSLFMLDTDFPQPFWSNVMLQTILYPGSQPCFVVLLPGMSSFTYDYSVQDGKHH